MQKLKINEAEELWQIFFSSKRSMVRLITNWGLINKPKLIQSFSPSRNRWNFWNVKRIDFVVFSFNRLSVNYNWEEEEEFFTIIVSSGRPDVKNILDLQNVLLLFPHFDSLHLLLALSFIILFIIYLCNPRLFRMRNAIL